MSDGPIFLSGMDRSGIGLLGELLEAHPDVAMTRRLNFWDFFADRHGDLADEENLDACIAAMMRYSRVSRLGIDAGALRADFLEGPPTYARLFELLHRQHMANQGKRRWGDKSLGSVRHADRIMREFPTASFIHVLRDPRDRHASQSDHRSAGRGGVGSATAAWNWSIDRAAETVAAHPLRATIVRYEDLVGDAVGTLTRVCDVAGLEYDRRMFTGPDGSIRELHQRSVGRFRRDLGVGEVRFIERRSMRRMEEWGYHPARMDPSGRDARSVLVEPAKAMLGYALWRPWGWLRRLGGRRPSDRRTTAG